jgi:SAM-dependent methyltransferase
MEMRMFQRTWHSINLLEFPAAAQCRNTPAGPEFYAQFYQALEAGKGKVDSGWAEAKRNLGKTIEAEFLLPWTELHGRKPRILSLGAGKALSEQVWLENSYDVTLQECQSASLKGVSEKFPKARILIEDVCNLKVDEKYDVIAMLALDCALNRQDLIRLLAKAKSWLSPDGVIVFHSVNTLSLRQLAAEIVKKITARHIRVPHIFWGWWRSLGEYCHLAKQAGLSAKEVYCFGDSQSRSKQLVLRSGVFQRTVHLRGGNCIMIFSPRMGK